MKEAYLQQEFCIIPDDGYIWLMHFIGACSKEGLGAGLSSFHSLGSHLNIILPSLSVPEIMLLNMKLSFTIGFK